MNNVKFQLENAKIVRETEKALLVEVLFGDEFKKQLWFPKSQVEVKEDGSVWATDWILTQKEREVGSYAPAIATVL